MEFRAIISSTIKGAHYAADTQVLTIEFKSGARYKYTGVPQEEYDALMTASSAGSYFHNNIRDAYPTQRV
jgi:hypothetical protein